MNVKLLLEGDLNKIYIRALLDNAGIDNVSLYAGGGMNVLRSIFAEFKDAKDVAFLIDSDDLNIRIARESFSSLYGFPKERIFVAVPSIEAWAFADIEKFKQYSKSRSKTLDRISTPDEIAYPKHVLRNFFRGDWSLMSHKVEAIFREMDISIACASSPSLADFLAGIAKLTGNDPQAFTNSYAKNFDLDIIANLIREVSPKDKVVFRRLNGESITAEEMGKLISKETDEGKRYASEILRVARDLLARKSND